MLYCHLKVFWVINQNFTNHQIKIYIPSIIIFLKLSNYLQIVNIDFVLLPWRFLSFIRLSKLAQQTSYSDWILKNLNWNCLSHCLWIVKIKFVSFIIVLKFSIFWWLSKLMFKTIFFILFCQNLLFGVFLLS